MATNTNSVLSSFNSSLRVSNTNTNNNGIASHVSQHQRNIPYSSSSQYTASTIFSSNSNSMSSTSSSSSSSGSFSSIPLTGFSIQLTSPILKKFTAEMISRSKDDVDKVIKRSIFPSSNDVSKIAEIKKDYYILFFDLKSIMIQNRIYNTENKNDILRAVVDAIYDQVDAYKKYPFAIKIAHDFFKMLPLNLSLKIETCNWLGSMPGCTEEIIVTICDDLDTAATMKLEEMEGQKKDNPKKIQEILSKIEDIKLNLIAAFLKQSGQMLSDHLQKRLAIRSIGQ